MYTTVYYHHVCRIARAMFEKALEYCIENEILNARDLLIMDDYDIVCFLRGQRNYAGEIMKMIDERKLFKRALYVEVSRAGINIDRIDPKIAEMEIADKSGIDVKWIAVDIPKLGEGEEFKALVNVDGELKRLDEVSTLVSHLKLAERNNIRIGVYTKKEYVDVVRKVAVDYFAVDKTYQKTLF
jgi:HD superfamily phosphohydrolase